MSTDQKEKIHFRKVEGESPRYVSRYKVLLDGRHLAWIGQVEQRSARLLGTGSYRLYWFARPPEQQEIHYDYNGEPKPFTSRTAAAEALRDLWTAANPLPEKGAVPSVEAPDHG